MRKAEHGHDFIVKIQHVHADSGTDNKRVACVNQTLVFPSINLWSVFEFWPRGKDIHGTRCPRLIKASRIPETRHIS